VGCVAALNESRLTDSSVLTAIFDQLMTPVFVTNELVIELAKVFADLKCGALDVAVGRAMASVAAVILKGWEQTAIRRRTTLDASFDFPIRPGQR
jgi:hypothetical protein